MTGSGRPVPRVDTTAQQIRSHTGRAVRLRLLPRRSDDPHRFFPELKTERDFAPGHEQEAIQARIPEHFGGSALALIHWIDKTHPHSAS